MCCLVPECGHLKRQLGQIQRYNAGEIPISGPAVHCCKVCTVAISGVLHQAVATAQHYLASLSFLVLSASLVLLLSFLLVLLYCTLTRYKDSTTAAGKNVSLVSSDSDMLNSDNGQVFFIEIKQNNRLILTYSNIGLVAT